MLVEDVMSRDPLYIEESTFVTNARQIMRDNHIRSLPVVNSQEVVTGVITSKDVLKVTSTRSNVTVDGFVVKVPVVTEEANVTDAARLMLSEKASLLPVVQSQENPTLKGVISIVDIFKCIDLEKLPEKNVSEIMNTHVVTAVPEEPITKIWDKMLDEDLTGLPVVSSTGEILGMITRFDILKRGWARTSKEDDGAKVKDDIRMKVEKLMSTPLYSVNPDDDIRTAIEVMLKREIGRISVVDNGKLVGIVDRYDLIKSYLGE